MSGITPLFYRLRFQALPFVISASVCAAPMALALTASSAWAQEAEYRFDIPAGPLDEAVAAYSRLAGATVSYAPGTASGRTSPGLHGRYTAAEALDLLLSGAGVQAVQRAQGSYSLVPLGHEQGGVDLAPISVTGQGEGLGNVSEGTGAYTVGEVSIGKAPLSIKETPQTVSVISQQRLQDQQLVTLGKALQQTTGITEYQGSMTSARYLSRGFEITNFRLDGGASLQNAAWMDMDTAIYDHMEVLRGADGLFAGAGEPGGTVNLVRKRPTAVPQASLMLSAGSWDSYRQELDVSGPLAFDGALRGRLVAVNQTRDSFIDYASANRTLYYGVLEADLGESTTVYGGLSHDRLRASDQDYGLPRASTGEDLKLPRSTYLAGADDVRVLTNDTYFLHVNQQLGERWALSLDSQYNRQREFRDDYNFNGSIDPETGAGSFAEGGVQHFPKTERALDLAVKGTFDLFGLEHGLTLGWNWMDRKGHDELQSSGSYVADNIFDFDPTAYPSSSGRSVPSGLLDERVRKQGLYGALRLQLAEPLHWFIGGSLNDYRYHYVNTDLPSGTGETVAYQEDDVFLPYTGLTYDLTPEWTAYASVAEIYKSQADRFKGPLPGSAALDPITGRNHELGIKGELLDGRLNTYVALYYTQRNGEAVRDPRYPARSDRQTGASCCFNADGEVVSKGVDVELSGELAEGLQATFGYTYNHNENRRSGAAYNSLTPRHLAKLFGTYQLPGAWSQWKLGGGVTAQSASYVSGSAYVRGPDGKPTDASVDYRFGQAGYALWSAFASYRIDEHWSVSANGENLFDKKYYSTVGYSDYANFYGMPRNFTVSVRAQF